MQSQIFELCVDRLVGICMGGILRIPTTTEYEVHQVGPKNYGSQNFSFLAFIGTELVSRKISATVATARDRRKKFCRSKHVIFP
jgi:hypothetical protein